MARLDRVTSRHDTVLDVQVHTGRQVEALFEQKAFDLLKTVTGIGDEIGRLVVGDTRARDGGRRGLDGRGLADLPCQRVGSLVDRVGLVELLDDFDTPNEGSKIVDTILQDEQDLLALVNALVILARLVNLVNGSLEILKQILPVAHSNVTGPSRSGSI